MIGTMPLLRPNTGMNTKLWSLKYTPNTATAVDENAPRIRFMPNVITEPIACMIIEGTPILRISLIVCTSGVKPRKVR